MGFISKEPGGRSWSVGLGLTPQTNGKEEILKAAVKGRLRAGAQAHNWRAGWASKKSRVDKWKGALRNRFHCYGWDSQPGNQLCAQNAADK